jgi:hypothetical protein
MQIGGEGNENMVMNIVLEKNILKTKYEKTPSNASFEILNWNLLR